MSRSARLLALLQLLRSHRHPVSGADLADRLGVSLRTVYRDIAALQAQGASIDGEAGVGYVLRPGFLLPPLMFSQAELEALMVGSRWVSRQTDGDLADAAQQALSKIAAVLPRDLKTILEDTTLLVVPATDRLDDTVDLSEVRRAMRGQQKIRLVYRTGGEAASERVIWPLAIGFFERVRMVVGWCELREDFRVFRTDRMTGLCVLDQRYPGERKVLLARWRRQEGIAES